METIFIQIASYRDPELVPTINDLIDKAANPNNLRFGIAWQNNKKNDAWDNIDLFKNDKRFRIIDIDYKQSQGVCWARNKVQQLYNNEKYTLQIDSHHRFIKDWDILLIDMVKNLQNDGYNKPLITTYLPSYNPKNDPSDRVMVPWKMNFDRFIPEGAVFFLPAPFDNNDDITKTITSRFYSAHFAFTLGDFVKEVQHDPNYYFHGEEISIAVRAFTHGYDLFHPNIVVAWHEYTRKDRTKQWDDDKTWHVRNQLSHLRNRKLFGMDNEKQDIDFEKYGFGNIRSLTDYEKYSGLSFKSRSITDDVIYHKNPNLNNIDIPDKDFQESLQHIFKYCINLPSDKINENDYDFWVVAFHDAEDRTVYRKDSDKEEIKNTVSNGRPTFYNIWREFHVSEMPKKWVVWPHSLSKGWCEKIEGSII
jgi:hypothetical protein